MSKKIIMGLVIMSFLMLPGIAKADFFNDGRWYMDSSQWEYITDWDPEGRGSLVDSDNKLNWITTSDDYPDGWIDDDDYEANRVYGSKWAFDLEDDFEFTVGFHYDHAGTCDTDEGGVGMVLVYWEGGAEEPSHVFSIDAGNSYWNGSNKNTFSSDMVTPSTETNSWWKRTDADGMFYARYDADEDRLQFSTLEGSYPTWEDVGGTSYYGLKNDLEFTQLRLAFTGWSDGAGLGEGNAYLKDFQVHNGTITPEPVSSVLFLVGGAFLAALRYKRRKA